MRSANEISVEEVEIPVDVLKSRLLCGSAEDWIKEHWRLQSRVTHAERSVLRYQQEAEHLRVCNFIMYHFFRVV